MATSTGRRTALAKWLTSPENALPARVMANRIWHYHFGRGIVATPSDFGMMGEKRTHPELLALGGLYASLYHEQFETQSPDADPSSPTGELAAPGASR